MAEITDKKPKRDRSEATESVHVETGPIELAVELEGFTPEEVGRLLSAKEAVARGKYSDLTEEYKRLLFVAWMIEKGILKS